MHSMPVDQGEFELLYRTHYARLIRLCCLWLHDPHEAEDVVQEVLLKLLKVAQSPYRPTAWEPWLTRLTRNAGHDRGVVEVVAHAASSTPGGDRTPVLVSHS